jgi:uncharacterized membrane protein YraQ (UPF0718 family)
MEQLFEILRFVAESAWAVLPVFLLSISLGVLVRALKLDGAIRKAFSARIGVSILLATAVGAFSPFCSCTVIPLIAGLLIAGVPLAPVMAFWVASPTMDPEVFALSAGLLGWDLAVARLLATLTLSLGAGYLTLALTKGGFLRGAVLRRKVEEEKRTKGTGDEGCCAPAASVDAPTTLEPVPLGVGGGQTAFASAPRPAAAAPPAEGACGLGCAAGAANGTVEERWWAPTAWSLRELSWRKVSGDVAKEGWRLGRWLLLAFVLEALILAYVPQEAIAGVLGGSNPFAVPLAALVGAPLYMTEVAALPVVSGLLEGGMSPGAAIAFLIAGPATTVPAMAAVWALVRPRVFALYVGIVVVGAAVLGFLTDVAL